MPHDGVVVALARPQPPFSVPSLLFLGMLKVPYGPIFRKAQMTGVSSRTPPHILAPPA